MAQSMSSVAYVHERRATSDKQYLGAMEPYEALFSYVGSAEGKSSDRGRKMI